MNSVLWLFVATPARLTGCAEGIKQIFFGESRPVPNQHGYVQYFWLGADQSPVGQNLSLEAVA